LTIASTSHNSETNNGVPDIVHVGREAQLGVSAAVVACEKKMFSMVDVIGLVWNSSFFEV
jgi:hypothetical protein